MKIFTLLNLFVVYVSSQNLNKCQNIKNFDQKDEYSENRLTSITLGNYTIQALTTFTTGEQGCKIVSRDGLVRTYAIKYAIDLANNDTKLKKWAKIGMRLDDDCGSLPITMARGIEIVSLIRENSVCRAEFLQCSNSTSNDSSYMHPAAGIIGTSMSFTTIPLASLMSLYLIPQISFSASSRLLSKVELYKSFFRTIPSDVNQISVMLDVIEAFNWNYIFAIGSDDDYGKLGISELESRARNRSICITETHYVAYKSQSTSSRITSIVKNMIANSKALIVVLFCYVENLGDLILDEAKRNGVKRIWLTSDAWNPPASNLNVTLKDQAHGILSVSLKSHKLPKFVKYMTKEIQTDFLCNMWLQNFLKNTYKCEPFDISPDKLTLNGNNCTVKINDLIKELSSLPGKTSNLIDAVTVLTRAIQSYLEINCNSDINCSIPTLDYASLTNIVKNVTFNNSLHELIKFDVNGDPEFIFYTIENLQFINNSFKYIPIGNWSKTRVKSLIIDKKSIKWPSWFNIEQNTSRCSEDCKKGQYVTAKIGCCWKCENCTDNNYSDTIMAETCKTCEVGNHTEDHIVCKVTPIKWLKYSDTEGIAIIVVSGVGLLLNVLAFILLLKLRSFLSSDGSLPCIVLSCILPFFTFVFGFLYIVKPTVYLCHSRNVIFFLLLMAYSSVLMIKTKIARSYLESRLEYIVKGHLFAKQTVLMIILMLIEVGSIIAWIIADSKKDIVQAEQVNFEIQKRCFVDFTAARLVSTFIPFILLIIATCCAFQERNNEHPFYEPKFLSFTTIALCIITVAFLPTFKYVKGNFKGIVMVFTTCVFGFTYMACLILPKIYVVHARQNRKDSFSDPYIKPSKVSKPEKEREENGSTETTSSDIKVKNKKLTSSLKSSIKT